MARTKTPSETGKRELGQSFKSFPVDVAIFGHPSHVGEYEHLQIIVETKAPNKVEGVNQLQIYMRRDDQLNNLCNVILAKLEGDKAAKYSPDDPVPFQELKGGIKGDVTL